MNKLTTIFKESTPWKIFLFSVLMAGISYGLYKGIIDNYLAEIVGCGEFEKGITEFFRELPGVMMIVVLAVFYMQSAENLYKIGSIIFMIGMALHAIVPPTKVLITLAILVMSTGEHIHLTVRNYMPMNYSHAGKSGTALGYQNSIHQAGTLFGYVVVALVFAILPSKQPYNLFFWLAAAFAALCTVCSFKLTSSSKTDESAHRFYFKKKFKKYYMLEVFYGSRKQVFLTFGPYVLILFYGASTAVVSLLFAITSIVGFVVSPLVGRIIDRLGYRLVMIADTLILVIVCFLYGFSHMIFPKNVAFIICCVNYVLDSIISLASMASNVYVEDIAENEQEIRATLSTGISVNHIISIFIALFGGLIWKVLGMQVLFIVSAVLGLCNSAYAASIKTKDSD